jgi:hypothetical protein
MKRLMILAPSLFVENERIRNDDRATTVGLWKLPVTRTLGDTDLCLYRAESRGGQPRIGNFSISRDDKLDDDAAAEPRLLGKRTLVAGSDFS